MLIAQLKKETNIVEYVLYMYQIEDIIRSLEFDMEKIEAHIISQFDQPEKVKAEIRNWYIGLIREMKAQNIVSKGHLNSLVETITGLDLLHQTLLTTIQDKTYQDLYDQANQPIKDLVRRSGGHKASNEIDIAINALYGLLLLRLKKQNISAETEQEMNKISNLLARLSHQYREMKVGNLRLPEEKSN